MIARLAKLRQLRAHRAQQEESFRRGPGSADAQGLRETVAGQRDFLPRPLGQEDASDPWEAWTPLFDWLIEHHPAHFHAVCSAEDTLTRMEREGITSGGHYEAASRDLLVKFEAARRLKLKAGAKIWMQ